MQDSGFIRGHQRLVSIAQRLLDVGTIFFSLMLSILIYPVGVGIGDRTYLLAAIIASCFFYVIASHMQLYQSYRTTTLFAPIKKVLQVWLFSILCLLMIAFALKYTAYFSRIILVLWSLSTACFFIISRVAVRGILVSMRSNGRNSRKIALAGYSQQGLYFAEQIADNPWMGYELAGYYDDNLSQTMDIKHLGDFSSLIKAAKSNDFDAIYIALPMQDEQHIQHLVGELSDSSTPLYYLPDLFMSSLMGGQVSTIGKVTSVSVYGKPYDAFGAMIKRTEDIVLSLLILGLISPLMLIITLLIKLTSKGPAVYRQKRYGVGGQAITVYKFRSMSVADDDEHVIVQAQRLDTRITPLGHWLRRTSLDELPQFINVLQGRMSIVGPRPHAVAHNEQYRKTIEGYMLRHLVKPGITGWAQINGWRGETDTHEKMQKRIEYDLHYLNNWSVGFDIKIIVMTLFKGFVNKNAY